MEWKHHAVLALGLVWGSVWAQPAVTPATASLAAMSDLMSGARQATQDVALLLTGERLTDPTLLRDLSEVTNNLSLLMRDMADYAEAPRLTPQQRERLRAMLTESRLKLNQIIERARQEIRP